MEEDRLEQVSKILLKELELFYNSHPEYRDKIFVNSNVIGLGLKINPFMKITDLLELPALFDKAFVGIRVIDSAISLIEGKIVLLLKYDLEDK